jgi:hypothetical protein
LGRRRTYGRHIFVLSPPVTGRRHPGRRIRLIQRRPRTSSADDRPGSSSTESGVAGHFGKVSGKARNDAGKTLEIDLFDVGDVSGQAVLYVQSPDGNVYTNATFNFTADSMCASSCSANGVTSITATTSGGSHPYNDSWLTILIPLPSTYGSVGLTPPGETQPGWWKIDYRIAAGVQSNDTTTWRVGVRGNPVHLIVP